jgi:5-formyltetrahydrofolate cyclo-ligase
MNTQNIKIQEAGLTLRLRSGSMVSAVEPLTKRQIRSKILLKLKTQKEEDRDRKSKAIKKKLFRALVFRKAKVVMFYMSFDGEVNTEGMIKGAHRLGKIVAVPVCKKHRLTLRPCILRTKAKLKNGPYGICEPAVKEYIKLEDLDLVIVPGIAFDEKGNRLGRGRGCYDYFLKRVPRNTARIGLAFDFQILPSIPATTTDVKVGKVIFA